VYVNVDISATLSVQLRMILEEGKVYYAGKHQPSWRRDIEKDIREISWWYWALSFQVALMCTKPCLSPHFLSSMLAKNSTCSKSLISPWQHLWAPLG